MPRNPSPPTPDDPIYQRIISTLPQKKDAIVVSIPEHPDAAVRRAIDYMIRSGEVTVDDDGYVTARDPE